MPAIDPTLLLLSGLLDGAQALVQAVLADRPDLDSGQLRRLAELSFLPGEPVQSCAAAPAAVSRWRCRWATACSACVWPRPAASGVMPLAAVEHRRA